MKNTLFENLNIKITKNARAKSMKIRLDKTGDVLLTLPKWTPKSTGLRFVKDNLEWIEEHRQKIGAPKHFADHMQITVLGVPYTIIHDPNAKAGVLKSNNTLIVSGQSDYLHRRVRDYIKKAAYEYIQKKALEMAAVLQKKPTKITLRDTSSRWGSCSSAGHLSFCWKLALAPDYVLDYIIAHEVSHLREMNHSSAFWATVGLLNVRQADAQIWLRKNGCDLQAWE